MDVKVSADRQTKETFNLMEHVSKDQVQEVMAKINANKQYKAVIENDTLIVKQFIRD